MTNPTARSSVSALALVLALAVPGAFHAAAPPAQPSINQRPTTARAQITGSPRLRDGSFEASGVSGVCGEIPKEASLTGAAVFVVEFPSDAQKGSITSIAFGSSQLVAGSTKATVFRLSVGVVTANGGRPPNYVLNTDSKRPGNAGTATLSEKNGVTTLRVSGKEEMGESIDLTVVCSPGGISRTSQRHITDIARTGSRVGPWS